MHTILRLITLMGLFSFVYEVNAHSLRQEERWIVECKKNGNVCSLSLDPRDSIRIPCKKGTALYVWDAQVTMYRESGSYLVSLSPTLSDALKEHEIKKAERAAICSSSSFFCSSPYSPYSFMSKDWSDTCSRFHHFCRNLLAENKIKYTQKIEHVSTIRDLKEDIQVALVTVNIACAIDALVLPVFPQFTNYVCFASFVASSIMVLI